jgi:hypothetical protein
MKFYAALNSIGQTILCATQAEAKLIDKNFTVFDIATDQKGLMAFAQSALDDIFHSQQALAAKEPLEIAQAALTPNPTPTLSKKVEMLQQVAITALMIEDHILYKATMGEIEAIFACLGNRFKQMAREVQDNAEPSAG